MSISVIGLTTYRSHSLSGLPTFSLVEAYGQALSRAGAAPVMIPSGLSEQKLRQILHRLDGILYTGGGDLHPHSYGSQPHPRVSEVDTDRDRTELQLFGLTREVGMPFLGICRGLQLINVAMGGTLYEDILDQRPGSLRHDFSAEYPRQYLAHWVEVEPSSRLAQILNTESLKVNSMHHQAIDQLAAGLRATAYAPDGIIEAVEFTGYPYGLAVQWHPEWMEDDKSMDGLFETFVKAAQKYREQ